MKSLKQIFNNIDFIRDKVFQSIVAVNCLFIGVAFASESNIQQKYIYNITSQYQLLSPILANNNSNISDKLIALKQSVSGTGLNYICQQLFGGQYKQINGHESVDTNFIYQQNTGNCVDGNLSKALSVETIVNPYPDSEFIPNHEKVFNYIFDGFKKLSDQQFR